MIDNTKMNEMAEDYLQILSRVSTVIPKTMTVRRADEIESTTETIELCASDYKDIASCIFIQHSKDKAKSLPVNERQLSYVFGLVKRDPDKCDKLVIEYLASVKKEALKELTADEASKLIDDLKAALGCM